MADREHVETPNAEQFPTQRPPAEGSAEPIAPSTAEAAASARAMSASRQQLHRVRRTRVSGVWIGVTAAALVLLVLLVFIIQNGQHVEIWFLGAHSQLPVGVALLLAAICGVLLVAVPGYGRIIQLRRAMKRAGSAGRHR